MTTIEQRLLAVQQQIADYAGKYQRKNGAIQLLAVSKTKPVSDIEALFQCGQTAFGENYLQEAEQKIQRLSHLAIEWHFIGGIQSNKTQSISQLFDWVHSVASLKHAKRLNQQRPDDKAPLNVCIQINSSGEQSKDGINPAEATDFAQEISSYPNLQLRGLMALPASADNLAQQRAPFRLLRELQSSINATGLSLDTLSMGMSNDLEAAIAESATIVRIGTALFGQRNKKPI